MYWNRIMLVCNIKVRLDRDIPCMLTVNLLWSIPRRCFISINSKPMIFCWLCWTFCWPTYWKIQNLSNFVQRFYRKKCHSYWLTTKSCCFNNCETWPRYYFKQIDLHSANEFEISLILIKWWPDFQMNLIFKLICQLLFFSHVVNSPVHSRTVFEYSLLL